MNGKSGAKRRSYTGAFKLMHLLKILGTRAGREYKIIEKNRSGQVWPAEQCRYAALDYGSLLCSGQTWLSLLFLLCWYVVMGALFSVWLSV